MHYEHALSQLHPTYIAQLDAEHAITKNGADINLLYLTSVIICTSGAQVIMGESADSQLELLC